MARDPLRTRSVIMRHRLVLLACALFAAAVACVPSGTAADAKELASFAIREPLGRTWTDEWLTRDVTLDPGGERIQVGRLALLAAAGEDPDAAAPEAVPAQFFGGRILADHEFIEKATKVRLRFRATIPKNTTVRFRVTDEGRTPPPWPHVTVTRKGERLVVANGVYEMGFDPRRPLPINAMRMARTPGTLGAFAWPEGVEAVAVENAWENGPAVTKLVRTFRFKDPAHRYTVHFAFRAGDPWIDIVDEGSLGPGSAVTLDLSALEADVVYHPHTYSPRTFRAGGKAEDTTFEPPQHPIATLAPIWQDIWFGGGPFVFVYRTGGPAGVGLAAVRGSQWQADEGVGLRALSLGVHGHPEKPGRVRVEVPTPGGRRRWALVLGPPEVRKAMGRMVRSHADTPLEKVLKEWVLDWQSDAPEHSCGFAHQWLDYFNKHALNPTTFPRRIRVPEGPVRSKDLAVLAYQFTNPDYWPGPEAGWGNVGNPNFHTDMYRIPLEVGLAMPDHPHARRWVQYGVEETRKNLMRDSFPGGAWAESLSYSSYFFNVVRMARRLREAGAATPFRDWPRFKEVATYLACMHTPVDPRYGSRQKAPIGDTHPGNYIEPLNALADAYRGVDEPFAEQLARFPRRWEHALDLSSREFYGFGAMLRGSPYDERHESFVTVKAGPARNHYQGDELSFYFASLGTPLAIDYACHYSPRPWSAAMHNRPDADGKRPLTLACRRAFASGDAADVFVADERTRRIRDVPMLPHETTKPGWEYPTATLAEQTPWTMRRYVMLVKHDPGRSKIADYLVVRDEISSPQPVGWNLHVLGRRIERDEVVFTFPGQLDVDLAAHVLTPEVGRVERRQWGWKHVKTSDLRTTKGKVYEQRFFGAWIPEDFKRGTWDGGEMATWLRLRADAGRSHWLVLLVPAARGRPVPTVDRLTATSARVTLGEESEVVHLGSGGTHQAAVARGGRTEVLQPAGTVPPWDRLDFTPAPPKASR